MKSFLKMSVLRFDAPVEAWNVDGSSDALAGYGSSWLRRAEEATGRRRGRCSFKDCPHRAEVGGHVWIRRWGCFIAPICRSCNNPNNEERMQGAGARLRPNVEVTKTQMTEGMRTADRRVPLARLCGVCERDISDRPDTHELCLGCWRGSKRARM